MSLPMAEPIKKIIKKILPARIINRLRSWKNLITNIRDIYRFNRSIIEKPTIRQSFTNTLNATRKLFHQRKTILFYPDLPNPASTLHKICLNLGYRMINNNDHKFDLVVKWRDDTFYDPDESFKILKKKYDIVNGNCLNISKSFISQSFENVFGYSLHIDPTTYNGQCLKKSEINAVRDEEIIPCPITKPEPGFVYQKLINNQIKDNGFKDIRVPIVKGHIPFLYFVYRAENQRFIRGTVKVELKKSEDEFSDEEAKKIKSFCTEISMDFGELDVLRDQDDHKIYIVDANNTPSGPPKRLDQAAKMKVINALSDLFKKHFIDGID